MIQHHWEQRRLIVLVVVGAGAGVKIEMNNRRKPSWPAAAVVTNGPRPAATTPPRRNGLLITAAAVLVLSWVMGANAVEETLSNIPQTLSSGECLSGGQEEECETKVRPRIQKPKSRKAESCTIKCVTTCIRGGDGSPGEGPLNVRRYGY